MTNPANRAPHSAAAHELLTSSFVARHTRYPDLDHFLQAGGATSQTLHHLDGQPLQDWDVFIRSSTRYADWHAMLREAGAEWLIRRMGIVVDH